MIKNILFCIVVALALCTSFFAKAAASISGDAEFQEGMSYLKGNGVPRDVAKGIQLIRVAAEQGHADAQNKLGDYYKNGRGVVQSNMEAVAWYRKAAEQGHAVAQCNLGYCYDVGCGVEQSKTEAWRWYKSAVESSYTQVVPVMPMPFRPGVYDGYRGNPMHPVRIPHYPVRGKTAAKAAAAAGIGATIIAVNAKPWWSWWWLVWAVLVATTIVFLAVWGKKRRNPHVPVHYSGRRSGRGKGAAIAGVGDIIIAVIAKNAWLSWWWLVWVVLLVSIFFEGWWWLVWVVLVVAIIFLAVWGIKRRKKRRWRRIMEKVQK